MGVAHSFLWAPAVDWCQTSLDLSPVDKCDWSLAGL